jgi:sulfate transporter 4
MVAFISTLFVGAEMGLCIAVGISLLLVLFESAYPPTAELGRLPGTHQYRNVKQYPDSECYDGIVMVRVDAPIYFANVQHVREKIQKYYQRAEETLHRGKEERQEQGLEEHAINCEVQRVKFVIIDLTPVGHIDTSALHALHELSSAFQKNHEIQLCLADPNPRVMHRLVSSGFADEIGRCHIFVSLHDAVAYCLNHMDTQELQKQQDSSFQGSLDPRLSSKPAIDDLMKDLEPCSAYSQQNDTQLLGFPSSNTIRDFSVTGDVEVGYDPTIYHKT